MKKSILLSLLLVLIVPTHNSFAVDMQTADRCFAPVAIVGDAFGSLFFAAASCYYFTTTKPNERSSVMGCGFALASAIQAATAGRDIYQRYLQQKKQKKAQSLRDNV